MSDMDRSDELADWYAEDSASDADLLDALANWYGTYLAVTDPDDLRVIALWTVHTHLAVELYSTPRLLIDSTTWGSGKTTLLDHLRRLCHRPVQASSISSSALIPRLLQDGVRTLLIDEVDRSLNPKKPGVEELIALINSGYRRGATRPVLVPVKGGGWEAVEMPTHAPVAMAGNSPHLPDDTKSRQIRVLLMPDIDGTVEDSDWEVIETRAERLHDQLAAFADRHRESVAREVTLPEGCMGRMKEKWRPLKRVAVAAGGHWPTTTDHLIRRALDEDRDERDAGIRTQPPGMVLMRDLHAVWPDVESHELVPTKDLVSKLIWHNPEFWGEQSSYGKRLTDTRFGRLVAQASKVTSQRPGGRGPRGYTKDQFSRVWHRLGIGRDRPGAPGYPGAPGAESAECTALTDCTRLEVPPIEPGSTRGRFDAHPPCFHCDKPVTDRHQDEHRRYICPDCRLSERQAVIAARVADL